MEDKAVLVTGGAGYIGSHCCVALQQAGYSVIVLDNFVNSSERALQRVSEITGKEVERHELDLKDLEKLRGFFHANSSRILCVLHCAALKAVGESVQKPLEYYENNIGGSINLFRCMKETGVKSIVFSSSATVYGIPSTVPILESFPVCATNAYGRTKLYIEEILRDLALSDKEWKIFNLRYFNPCGAHPSGKIGEDPSGIPNNLMPYVSKVAVGKLEKLTVYGKDYDTQDGTGVRDYIHVVDLARGHVAAIAKLKEIEGEITINLGTGNGHSVLEMVDAMQQAAGKDIPYVFGERRAGDVPILYADTAKAKEMLGWTAEKNLQDMCDDLWRWQSSNPDGYRSASETN